MADDAPTPTTASTPNSPDHAAASANSTFTDMLDAAHIADLLATLDRIPRDELPDGAAREDLAAVIRDGLVDNLYRPMGADYHNIAWADRPAWEDPRQRLSEWLDEWGMWAEALDAEEARDE